MDLSQVSRTAILTLITHAVTSEKDNAFFDDPLAVLSLERLTDMATPEEKDWINSRRRHYRGMSFHDARAGAGRAKTFDGITERYITQNPHCTVVSLGAGFDTRFWRIAHDKCRYIEVDLPEVVAVKRELLKDQAGFEMIGCPVLDPAWIDQVTLSGKENFLLIAEGLFVWLPKADVIGLFQRLSQRFFRSQIALDSVPEKWLKGIWKILLPLEIRINWGLDPAQVHWLSGFKEPGEIETYAPGLKVLGEAKGSAGPIISVAINQA